MDFNRMAPRNPVIPEFKPPGTWIGRSLLAQPAIEEEELEVTAWRGPDLPPPSSAYLCTGRLKAKADGLHFIPIVQSWDLANLFKPEAREARREWLRALGIFGGLLLGRKVFDILDLGDVARELTGGRSSALEGSDPSIETGIARLAAGMLGMAAGAEAAEVADHLFEALQNFSEIHAQGKEETLHFSVPYMDIVEATYFSYGKMNLLRLTRQGKSGATSSFVLSNMGPDWPSRLMKRRIAQEIPLLRMKIKAEKLDLAWLEAEIIRRGRQSFGEPEWPKHKEELLQDAIQEANRSLVKEGYYLSHEAEEILRALRPVFSEYQRVPEFESEIRMLEEAVDSGKYALVRLDLQEAAWLFQRIVQEPIEESVTCLSIFPDGRHAIRGGAGAPPMARVWELESGREIQRLGGYFSTFHSLAISPDGERVLSGSQFGEVAVWDWKTAKVLFTFRGHQNSTADYKAVEAVAFSLDGRYAISVGWDGRIFIWDAFTGKEVASYTAAQLLSGLAVSPDGRQGYVGDGQGVGTFPIPGPGRLEYYPSATKAVHSLACSLDGKLLLTGGYDGKLTLWDTSARRDIGSLLGHTNSILSIAFSPDGKRALSCSEDHTARLWELSNLSEAARLRIEDVHAKCGSFTPDGRTAVIGHGGKELFTLWHLPETGSQIAPSLGPEEGEVNCLAFSLDGRMAARGGGGFPIYVTVWEVETGRNVKQFSGHSGKIWCVAFAPDGRMAASGGDDGEVFLWAVFEEKHLRLSGAAASVRRIAFSPDGRNLLALSAEGELLGWESGTGRQIFSTKVPSALPIVLNPHLQFPNNRQVLIQTEKGPGLVDSTARGSFSPLKGMPSGLRIQALLPGGHQALIRKGGELFLFDMAAKREIRSLGRISPLNSLAVNGDGRYALVGGGEQQLRWIEINSGKVVHSISGSQVPMTGCIALSPDGRVALSGRLGKAGFDQWEMRG